MKIARCRFYPRHLFSVIKVRSAQTPHKENDVKCKCWPKKSFEVNPNKKFTRKLRLYVIYAVSKRRVTRKNIKRDLRKYISRFKGFTFYKK